MVSFLAICIEPPSVSHIEGAALARDLGAPVVEHRDG